MKTEYEIYMNFKKAEAQVNKLRNIAQGMRSLANDDIEGTIGRIRTNWSGENSEAFLAKAQIIENKIGETANDIQRVADAIMSNAERTMRTELAAIGVAQG
ncbi:Proteins of 100 residues with WXG [Lachnospiraceae bacterium XBB2008]|nr:Proteins of 100 residues with WXG [Lachnospiraceae bacterium XBB2008]